MKTLFYRNVFGVLLALGVSGWAADGKNIVMIAGKPSHGPAQHEHNAGIQLLAKCLKASGLPVEVQFHLNAEWPSAEELGKADTIVIYSDGGGGHPALQADHLASLEKEMKRGCGFVCLHYAVEPTTEKGNQEFIEWLGGCFETHWSVNPHWNANFQALPAHPISSGVKPFTTNDEWYFHMRFRAGMKDVTPILSAIAPESTIGRGDGPHSGNPAAREEVKNGVPQHTAWAVQRADGGRGFGFTGGHFHAGWGNDDQRKLVLNGIAWTAKVDLPAVGVVSTVSEADLKQNLDLKPGQGMPEKPKPEAAAKPEVKTPANGERALGFEAAKEQMKGFKTAAGLTVSLVASEPAVENPTNIDIDPRGRVWAIECVNYRKWATPGLRPEGDRIVILESTKGDGVADKQTVFWQSTELKNGLGLCVLPNPSGIGTRVIASFAGQIWLLSDADGDDKAEKVEPLLKVSGSWDHDHHAHAVSFGADGKFYFNMGNAGTALQYADGTPVVDLRGNKILNNDGHYRQGMIFRCDIDLEHARVKNVETLAHNFRNNYEVAADSFGGLWQSDNDDDGNKGVRINAILDYGSYGYTDEMTGAGWRAPRTNLEKEIPRQHWHQNDPGSIPNLLQTGQGSPTGICVNESGILGKQFENQVIHCDAGPRTVRAYPVKKAGAGFAAEMVDILTSEDSWYRPSDCAIAPDGSMMVADWYDAGVGGHAMADHEAGKIRGRIYRVAPEGLAYKINATDFKSVEGLVTALSNPNLSTRYVAFTKLEAMGASAEGALTSLWASPNPRLRARGLHLLLRIPGKFEGWLEKALLDADADIRITALRELRIAAENQKLPAPIEKDLAAYLAKGIALEKDPQVLREYAVSLHIARDPVVASAADSFAAAWVALAAKYDGKDRWYLEALGIAAAGRDDRAMKAWLAAVGERWDTPAGHDLVWRVRSNLALPALTSLIADKKTEPGDLPRYLRQFDFLPANEERNQALVKIALQNPEQTFVTGEALKRLGATPMKDSPQVKAAMEATIAKVRGRSELIEMAAEFRLGVSNEDLLQAALADVKDPRAVQGIKMIASQPSGVAFLTSALTNAGSDKVVTLLGGSGDKEALKILASVLAEGSNADSKLRGEAVKALSLSLNGATLLVQLAESNGLSTEGRAAAQSALGMVNYPDLSERIGRVFPAAQSAGGKTLPSIPELLKLKGNAENGRALFAKAESSCTLCHRVGNLGVDFAPGLSEIGSKLGRDALFDSILNPNAGISMGFETTELKLKDGSSAVGIVRSETEDELVLVMPAGVTNTLRKSEVAGRKKLATSMMPVGLQAMFTQEQLVDLVEYLFSLKSVAK